MRVYAQCITAHPSEANQFALGLNDGGICVLELLESYGKWGSPLAEYESGTSNATGASQDFKMINFLSFANQTTFPFVQYTM